MPPEIPPSMVIAQRRMQFPQHPRERPGLVVYVFIALSIFLHMLAFYAFHVVYPEPQPYFARSASVVLVEPGSDWEPAMRTWLEQEDPSLLSRHRWNPGIQGQPGVYRPIWELRRPELQDIPQLDFAAIAGGPRTGPHPQDLLTPPRLSAASPVTPALAALRQSLTHLQFSWVDEPRELDTPPALRLQIPRDSTLQPPQFSLAITPDGRVSHILTRTSSNSAPVDAVLRRELRNLRFEPQMMETPSAGLPADALSWGHVRVFFGGQAFTDS